jgi:hypothetical protein
MVLENVNVSALLLGLVSGHEFLSCACVTSYILSHLLQTHEICSLQTVHKDMGVKRVPHALQDSLLYILFMIPPKCRTPYCKYYNWTYKYCT